ncbi:hypothetical protein MRX96_004546 [Rhipicephalus microplus]
MRRRRARRSEETSRDTSWSCRYHGTSNLNAKKSDGSQERERWQRLTPGTRRQSTDGKLLNACSVGATSVEEAAIALALNGTPEVTTILSDSRTAIANLGRRSIGTPATSLLLRSKSTTSHLRSTSSSGLTRPWLGKSEESKLLVARAGPAVVEV